MLRKVHLIRDEVLGEASSKYICSGHGGGWLWFGPVGKTNPCTTLTPRRAGSIDTLPKIRFTSGHPRRTRLGHWRGDFFPIYHRHFSPWRERVSKYNLQAPKLLACRCSSGWLFTTPLPLFAHSVLITKASPFPPILQDTTGNAISGTHCECVCVCKYAKEMHKKENIHAAQKKTAHLRCDFWHYRCELTREDRHPCATIPNAARARMKCSEIWMTKCFEMINVSFGKSGASPRRTRTNSRQWS